MSSPAYIVLDTETTGISPATDRVIEIAAVRVEDGVVTDRFSTLIDPGVRIPHRITRLTGITSADLVGAPPPDEVWARYLEFAGQDVRVAHNAAFDRGFVASELSRLGLPGETAPYLCTVRLSRRLLPGLPSKSLDSVARFLGVAVGVRHRALADAEITAEVLVRLADRAGRLGRGTASELLALQQSRYAATKAVSAHVEGILRDVIPGLPDMPGVYRLLDGRRRLLYVGKAISLRRRVGSYFVGVEGKPGRIRDLVTRARFIEVQETPSELEALLLEARLIRELQPPFNRALRTEPRRAWLRLDDTSVVARSAVAGEDGTDWFGPIASPGEAQALAEIVGAVFGLTVEPRRVRSPYDKERAERVERVFGWVRKSRPGWPDPGMSVPGSALPGPVAPSEAPGLRPDLPGAGLRAIEFLAGDTGWLEECLAAAMAGASAAFRFEDAALLRDWLEVVKRLSEEPGPLVTRVGGHHAVRFQRQPGQFLAVFSRPGRGLVVLRARDAAELAAALEWADSQPDTEYPDGDRLVAQWAFRNRDSVGFVERREGEAFDGFVDRVVRAAFGAG